MRKFLLTCLLVCSMATLAFARDAIVSNITYTLQDHDGFVISRKTSNGSFAEIARIPKTQNTYTDVGIQVGVVFCYTVAAYNATGVGVVAPQQCSTSGAVPAGTTTYTIIFQ